MSVAYTWTFPQFEVAPSSDGFADVVRVIHWRLDGSDGEYTGGAYGSVSLDAPNPNAFTPYVSITREWAIAAVTSKIELASIQTAITGEIERKKNPPVVPMLPPFVS